MHFQSQPASGGVLISRTENSSNTANPTFQCQWSSCSACFPTREELVGHVNVTHLLQAKATVPNQDCTPPTPAQSGVSGLSRLSETRDGSTDMDLSTYSLSQNPGSANNTSSSRQADSEVHPSAATNLNIFGGHLQNQPTDASFDHTLRCLWDSCEASVPILAGNFVNSNQPVDGHVSGQLPVYQSSGDDNVMKIAPHVPFQTLPDQSTASLVRHLLQDHLHLPTDVLGQMSPGLSLPQANVQQAHVHPANGPELSHNHSRHKDYITSGPSSNHSTPYSLPKLSAVNTPVNHRSPPTPPLASAEQQFRFDFGLPSIEAFNSWSAPATGTEQTKSEEKPQPSAEQIELKSESHACKWKGCSAVYANTADLMEHISSEHIGSGKSMYHCEWEGCDRAHEGRGFNQRQKVMRHVRTHVGDRPYVCTECGRAFSESTTLASVGGGTTLAHA